MAFFFKLKKEYGENPVWNCLVLYLCSLGKYTALALSLSLFHVPLLGILEDMYVKRYQEKD